MTERALTAKQEAFAQHYAMTGDATASYRVAYDAEGMQENSIRANGCKLLKNAAVAKRVEALKARKIELANNKFDVTAEKVLAELARIAFANVQDYVSVDGEGIPMPDFSAVTRQQFAAIGEVTFEDIETGQRTGKRVKFKLLDKKGALVDLGKHLGLFKDQAVVTHRGTITHAKAEDVAQAKDPVEALKVFDAFRVGLTVGSSTAGNA